VGVAGVADAARRVVGTIDAPARRPRPDRAGAIHEMPKGVNILARYLVDHTPRPEEETAVRPPSRMAELARASAAGATPRWLRTWSPDVHDDRIFSLWEAENAAQIQAALARYGFLNNMDALPLLVKEWGPDEILAAEASGESGTLPK